MKVKKSHIAKQIKMIKLAKILVVSLLGLSFALEFVMLNFISACKEQKIATVSYRQVTDDLVAVSDNFSFTINKEYQAFLEYLKKKHEEQNRHQTENHQTTSFNLFFVDKFSFQLGRDFLLKNQFFNSFYQKPFVQKALSEIFHPPKV